MAGLRLETRWRTEDGVRLPAVLWQPGAGYRMISSAVVVVMTLTPSAR